MEECSSPAIVFILPLQRRPARNLTKIQGGGALAARAPSGPRIPRLKHGRICEYLAPHLDPLPAPSRERRGRTHSSRIAYSVTWTRCHRRVPSPFGKGRGSG